MVAASDLINTLSDAFGLCREELEAQADALRDAALLPDAEVEVSQADTARMLLVALAAPAREQAVSAVRDYSELTALGAWYLAGERTQWFTTDEMLASEKNRDRNRRISRSILGCLEVLIEDSVCDRDWDWPNLQLIVSRRRTDLFATWQFPMPGTVFRGAWLFGPRSKPSKPTVTARIGTRVTRMSWPGSQGWPRRN